MVPTRTFWILVAAGIPLGGLAGYLGSPVILLAYNVLLAITAIASGFLAPSWKNIKISRRFDTVLSVRVPNKITVTVLNDGPEAIRFRMREELPPFFKVTQREFDLHLKPGEEQTITYSVTPNERGGDYFRATHLRIETPLKLVQREVQLRTEQPLRVYPNILALREFDLLKQRGRLQDVGIRRSRSKGLGMEFESLRDYTEGDDFRKIDWKATARRNKLVVRNYEQEKNQSVIICIDIGRKTLSEVNGVSKLDHMLDSSLMLCHAASVAGDCVGLLVYADTVRRYIPPKKGRNQIGFIIEAIHDLMAEPVESDATAAFAYLASRWKRRSLIVNFTDVDDSDQAKELGASYGAISKHHIALLASVGDPGLRFAASGLIDDREDAYRKAASLFLLSEKKTAHSVLGSQNVHVLEAEPQDLAAALVSFYFMVKERSLL